MRIIHDSPLIRYRLQVRVILSVIAGILVGIGWQLQIISAHLQSLLSP